MLSNCHFQDGSLFNALGGCLSLWLGISFCNLFEILELAFDLLGNVINHIGEKTIGRATNPLWMMHDKSWSNWFLEKYIYQIFCHCPLFHHCKIFSPRGSTWFDRNSVGRTNLPFSDFSTVLRQFLKYVSSFVFYKPLNYNCSSCNIKIPIFECLCFVLWTVFNQGSIP